MVNAYSLLFDSEFLIIFAMLNWAKYLNLSAISNISPIVNC